MDGMNTPTDVDLILHHLSDKSGESKLPEDLKKKLDRLHFCADLIRQHGSRLKVVPILRKKYDISQRQAYQDFQDTQEIFGSTPPSSKDFWVDILLGFIMETRHAAFQKKDFRAVTAAEKNLFNTIAEFFKGDQIPYDKIQPPPILLGFFPELSNVQIPADLDDQVKKLVAEKKIQIERIPEAEIIEEEEKTDGESEE